MYNFFSLQLIWDEQSEDNRGWVYFYDMINYITNLAVIILICFFWVRQARYRKRLDKDTKTDSDYAVMLTNLPHDCTNDEIKNAMNRAGVPNDHIVYINRAYNFCDLWKAKKEETYWADKMKKLKAFRDYKKHQGHENWEEMYPPTKIISKRPFLPYPKEEKIQRKLDELSEKCKELGKSELKTCGVAIVVTKYEQDTVKILDFFSFNRLKRYLKRYVGIA